MEQTINKDDQTIRKQEQTINKTKNKKINKKIIKIENINKNRKK